MLARSVSVLMVAALLLFPSSLHADDVKITQVRVSMWPFCREAPVGESWSLSLTQGDKGAKVLAQATAWKVEKTIPAESEEKKITRSFEGPLPKVDLGGEFILRVSGKLLDESKTRTNWQIEVIDENGRVYQAKALTGGTSAERRFKLAPKK